MNDKNINLSTCLNDDINRFRPDEYIANQNIDDLLPKIDYIRIEGRSSKQYTSERNFLDDYSFFIPKTDDEITVETEDSYGIRILFDYINLENKTIEFVIDSLFKNNKRLQMHSKRVSQICEAIAMEMNFSIADVHQISIAGLLHDIGKIGIGETVLNKASTLTVGEWEKIRQHSEIGYKMLCSIEGFSKIADCILEHHERWDGKGYPRGIKGENISLQARIIAVADAYDAMTSDRPYKDTISREEAIAEIKNKSGTQFDPVVAKVFSGMILNY